LEAGDEVVVRKEGTFYGVSAVVTEPNWNGMVKVSLDGATKSYAYDHLERVARKAEEEEEEEMTPLPSWGRRLGSIAWKSTRHVLDKGLENSLSALEALDAEGAGPPLFTSEAHGRKATKEEITVVSDRVRVTDRHTIPEMIASIYARLVLRVRPCFLCSVLLVLRAFSHIPCLSL
jgi:hypothetical protein